jgi:hypothetical protein
MPQTQERAAPFKRDPFNVVLSAETNDCEGGTQVRRRLPGESHIRLQADRTNVIDGPWWFTARAWERRCDRVMDASAWSTGERLAAAYQSDTDDVIEPLPQSAAIIAAEYVRGGHDLILIGRVGDRATLARDVPTWEWAKSLAGHAEANLEDRGVPVRRIGV